jgi:hypothetical protein
VDIHCGCKVRFYLGWLVFLRPPLVSHLDNLRKKRVIVIDRCCMYKMNESLWIIFFSIVRSLVLYGMPSLLASVCFGLCIVGW